MGASLWDARAPYQHGDVAAALRLARQDAYDRGDFYLFPPDESARSMTEDEYAARGIDLLRESVPRELADADFSDQEFRIEWRAAQVVVCDADSLYESQPFSETHSVIDMTHVADQPVEHAVAPAPEAYLLEHFGTIQPDVAAIEAAIDSNRLEGFSRWQGMYLVGYVHDKPETIFFVGYSGD